MKPVHKPHALVVVVDLATNAVVGFKPYTKIELIQTGEIITISPVFFRYPVTTAP